MTVFNADLLPVKQLELNYGVGALFANETHLITLKILPSPDHNVYQAILIPLDDLAPATPGEPVDPAGLAYQPHSVDLADDGTALITARFASSIFTWDPITQTYGDTVPLRGIPRTTAFSPQANTEYLLYNSGLITKVDFNAAQPQEALFSKVLGQPGPIATAGKYLVVTAYDQPGYPNRSSLSTLSPERQVINTIANVEFSSAVWSDANQKLYMIGSQFESLEINANGTACPGEPPGGIGDTFNNSNVEGVKAPMRLSGDESKIAMASGAIVDALTLANTGWLGKSYVDAAWLGDHIYTARPISAGTQLEHWLPGTYPLDDVAQAPGAPIALEAVAPDRLLAVTREAGGVPLLQVLDSELHVVPRLGNSAPLLDPAVSHAWPVVAEDHD